MAAPSHRHLEAEATRHRARDLPVAAAATHPTADREHHPIALDLVRHRDAAGLAPILAPPAAVPAAAHIGLGAQSRVPLRRHVVDGLLPAGGTAVTLDPSLDLSRLLAVGPVADGIHPFLHRLRLVQAAIGLFPARAVLPGETSPEGEAIRGHRLAGDDPLRKPGFAFHLESLRDRNKEQNQCVL